MTPPRVRIVPTCAAMAVLALVLSACGGGGNGPTTTAQPLTLPAGHEIPADTYTIPAGETQVLGNVEVSCPAGGMDCSLTIDSSTARTGSYQTSGGMPRVAPVLDSVSLPGGHGIFADTYTIPAGNTRVLGNVNVSCPSGGRACVLTIASGGATDGSYPRTGGTPTVEPALESVDLPSGHGIPPNTYTIPAGATEEHGNVAISCPAGGMACVVIVTSPAAATGTYQLTGGEPAFAPAGTTVALPAGHAIPADTYTIAAGATEEHGNVAISCPPGGMDCVLTVATPDAATGAFEATGGRPTVEPVLVDLRLPGFHGIASSDDVAIAPGSTHHGRRGISVACPAGGADCVVNFDDDGGAYHRTGAIPEILTHELVRAANDQDGRALSVFTRDQEDGLSGGNPVGYHLTNVLTMVTLGMDDAIEFELDYPNPSANREDRLPMLLDALTTADHTVVDSNIPELQSIAGAPAWRGVALSRSDSTAGLTIHANVYSDIEPDTLGAPDDDYLVLGVWLEVPDDVNLDTSLLGTFAYGSERFTSLNAVTGSATYKGPAIGLYEMREIGSSDDITIGSFVADTELNADFDSTVLREQVSGEISNFTENGQSLGDWVVDLGNNTGINTVGGRDIHGNPQISRDGGATFDNRGAEMEANFFGDSTGFPSSVAGSFWTEVGSRDRLPTGDDGYLGLTGAFGAYYCAPPC